MSAQAAEGRRAPAADDFIAVPFGTGNPPPPLGQPILRRETALAGEHSALVGYLPKHRFGLLELEAIFNPEASANWLVLVARRLDRVTGQVVESDCRVCHALPVLQAAAERDVYVREICLLLAPHLRAPGRTLRDLEPALAAASRCWDFLEVFKALQS
jgi:hypothetical protein